MTLLHGGSLGDFLLALRLLREIDAGRSVERRAVARSPMSALPHGALGLDALLDADRVVLHRLFAADAPVADELRRILADSTVVIDMLAVSGVARARLDALTGGTVVSLDPRPAAGCAEHIIYQWRGRLPEDLASHVVLPGPLIVVDAPDCDISRSALLHPGSGGRAKCWPVRRFIELAHRLRDDGMGVSFMLGPAEMDWHGDEWRRMLADHAPVIIESDLWGVAKHMSAADLYVGNDAGSTHLAASVGTPTVVIFGPTDPRVWRPMGGRVRVVAPPDGSAEIETIPLEAVWDACRPLIGRD